MKILRPSLVEKQAGEALRDGSLTGSDWIEAAAILSASLVLAVVISRVLRRVISHGIGDGFASIVMARLASYVVFLIGLFYGLTTLGIRVGPLLGALGFGGLVVALALQGVVENFVSSIILQARRPFTIGDTVELDGRIGVVADIDSRTTLLQALDGSQVRIPNSNVASETIVNLTREPARRSTLSVGVAYDTDLQSAQDVLLEAVGRVPRIRSEPHPMIIVTGFDESSIGMDILYWHASDIPTELATRSDLAVAVHQALHAHGITISFPQLVVWSGTDSSSAYDRAPSVVDTTYPGIAATSAPGKRRISEQFRRPSRRKGRD